jgi:hypothetical protein
MSLSPLAQTILDNPLLKAARSRASEVLTELRNTRVEHSSNTRFTAADVDDRYRGENISGFVFVAVENAIWGMQAQVNALREEDAQGNASAIMEIRATILRLQNYAQKFNHEGLNLSDAEIRQQISGLQAAGLSQGMTEKLMRMGVWSESPYENLQLSQVQEAIAESRRYELHNANDTHLQSKKDLHNQLRARIDAGLTNSLEQLRTAWGILLLCLLILLPSSLLAGEKVQEINRPIVLESQDCYNGENVILVPAEDFQGEAAFVIGSAEKITNGVTIENVSVRRFPLGLIARNTNYLCLTKFNLQGCEEGVKLSGCWDTTLGPAFRSIQCGTVLEIAGTPERYSNPTLLIDCRFESFSTNAVTLRDCGNVVFVGCKFHGKIDAPSTKPTIFTQQNYNCVKFTDCLFMFSKQHFAAANSEKLQISGAITDDPKSLRVQGRDIAKGTLTNQRGR